MTRRIVPPLPAMAMAMAMAMVLALAGCSGGSGSPDGSDAPVPGSPSDQGVPVPGAPKGAVRGGEPVIPSPGEGLRAPVDVIPHTIIPRPVEQDYVEVLRPAETGPVCAMLLQPQVRTPREGPWTITFVTPAGGVATKLPPQSVDPVTGQITLVAHTPFFGPGEWVIELDLVEGGLTHGPERQVFRFRVE